MKKLYIFFWWIKVNIHQLFILFCLLFIFAQFLRIAFNV